MEAKTPIAIPTLLLLFLTAWNVSTSGWIIEKNEGYTFYYKEPDRTHKKEYQKIVDEGIQSVRTFMDAPFPAKFSIYLHPDRSSLDSTWQQDWGMPEFQSACWMVASGIATKLDLLSPRTWAELACEHVYADQTATRQLITHELFHVYHGQLNKSPDFSTADGIDWFVEGFATYASGQCDSARMTEVRTSVLADAVPAGLEQFWSGKLKYGRSGSVVMYLDDKYGRAKLKALLAYDKKIEILESLNTTEAQLIADWKRFVADWTPTQQN